MHGDPADCDTDPSVVHPPLTDTRQQLPWRLVRNQTEKENKPGMALVGAISKSRKYHKNLKARQTKLARQKGAHSNF